MSELLTTEEMLIADKQEREKHLGRTDVLTKVKKLVTLPNAEILTTRMVADWFEVTQDVIRDNVRRNKEELENNGLIFKKYNEIKALVKREDISPLRISRRGTNVFSKRAVLNLAMFLRDSSIAKEVRANLLDVHEASPDEIKKNNIDHETMLLVNIAKTETDEELAIALKHYRNYNRRHISKLENTIQEQQPKVEVYEHLISSRGFQEMNDVAKSLKVGRNQLFRFLREKDIAVMMKGKVTPYQTYIDRGWFQVVQKPIKNGLLSTVTLVTPKGVRGISKLLRKHMDDYPYMHRYKDTVFTRDELSIESYAEQ